MFRRCRMPEPVSPRFVIRGSIVSICLLIGIGRADDAPRPDAAQIEQLIRELDHEEYAVRVQAMRELSKAEANALQPLIAALKEGSLERRFRVVELLGRIYGLGDEASFESAELALEDIRINSGGSLSAQARAVLESNYELRQKMATAAIRRLGGSVLFDRPGTVLEPEDPPGNEEPAERNVSAVVINQDWTGGDEGLRHIRRLSRLRVLYRVRKAPVSDDAMDELKNDMPALEVQMRGPAYLGITPFSHPRGCGINRVQPDSAAAKAGIIAQDVVTRFDGQDVAGFPELIELIGEKLPGDTVPISVIRDGQTLELKAELTSWPKEAAP